jgi:hypothetical protein
MHEGPRHVRLTKRYVHLPDCIRKDCQRKVLLLLAWQGRFGFLGQLKSAEQDPSERSPIGGKPPVSRSRDASRHPTIGQMAGAGKHSQSPRAGIPMTCAWDQTGRPWSAKQADRGSPAVAATSPNARSTEANGDVSFARVS